jgi:phenylpropionate dioxygenase-like ring-hydroxylating dioxygenase large terminal subunit
LQILTQIGPFHGWQFDKTGKCVSIPYCEGSIPEQAKVRSWPMRERNGMIHIFYHVDEVEPYWEVPILPEIESGRYIRHGKFSCYIRAHCQEVPEVCVFNILTFFFLERT